jgi:hypothetical protein
LLLPFSPLSHMNSSSPPLITIWLPKTVFMRHTKEREGPE